MEAERSACVSESAGEMDTAVSSCVMGLGALCLDWNARGAVGADQFGPNAIPIVRTQVPSAYEAIRVRFDQHAVFWRWLTIGMPMTPLTNLVGVQ